MSEPHSPKRLKATIPTTSMIILVGLPGSGKSTFSTKIVQQSPHRFCRINQDSIKNGKRGTRDMCINAAESALRQGINVIIDRTNVSPEQRRYFLDVAANAGLDLSNIHCVYLNLPSKECGARAAGRGSHEGGVFGPKAYGTVNMMKNQLKPPSLSEGFASVLECQNDAEIDLVVDLWVRYTTQIHNNEETLLNLNEEWLKIKPNRGTANKNSDGASGSGSGLQKLDKFFSKKNTISSGDGGGTSGTKASTSVPPAEVPSSSSQGRYQHPDAAKAQAQSGDNAFSFMMKASKNQQQQSPTAPTKQPTSKLPTTRHKFGNGYVFSALQRYLNNPEQLLARSTATNDNDLIVLYCDSQCIIVPDKYPKSRYHILVLARDQRLQGPLDLTTADSVLVQHMKNVGLRWARDHVSSSTDLAGATEFSVGFHSVPSLRQLHLHVLTKDYDSPSLKKKVHYNSFTTPFFLDVDWVLGQLERKLSDSGGSSDNQQYLEYDAEEKEALLKGDMKCPKCQTVLPRMPDVKAHVAECTGKRD
jgi:hypothetical protein